MSKTAYLKFSTPEDRQSGFRLLSEQYEIAFEDDVFCVPIESLRLLDIADINYALLAPGASAFEQYGRWRIAKATVPSLG